MCVIHAVPRYSLGRDDRETAAQFKLSVLPAVETAVVITAMFTSFSAATKFLTLGQFRYSHILLVCTKATTNCKS